MSKLGNMERYEQLLASTPSFEAFEAGELQALLSICEPKILAPREALWAVGSRGDAAYILVEGRIEQVRRLPPDEKRVDQIDEPGTMVGLSYLVKAWEHQSAATAVERTELLKLDRLEFEKMFEAQETAAFRLVDRLAEDLVQDMRDANRRLQEVFGSPAETLRTLRRRVRQA